MPPRNHLFLTLAVVGLAVVAPAQQTEPQTPEPKAPTVAELARSFRTADPGPDRDLYAALLIERGEDGAANLRSSADRMREKVDKRLLKERASHRRDFERAGAKALKRRQSRAQMAKVEKLRDEIAAFRRGDLTKATVKSEIDPRLEELRSMCTISVGDAFASDERLAGQSETLDELLVESAQLEAWSARAQIELGELEVSDDGGYPTAADFERRWSQRLNQDRRDAALRAMPISKSDRRALDRNDDLRGKIPAEELDGTLALNEIRLVLGLGAVAIDVKLGDAARDHSKDMDTLGFFSHTSPVEGKETFGRRAANFGTSARSENIAAGQSKGRGAIRAWWYSPGHHKNMMSTGNSRVGLGQFKRMWTQMFG